MQKILISILLIFLVNPAWASASSYAGPDTLVAETSVVSADLMLLDLVAEQGKELHIQDSIQLVADSLRKDSLLTELNRRDSLLLAQLQLLQDSLHRIHDSINLLLADEIAQKAIDDSIALATRRMDSIVKEIAELKNMPGLEITPSLIKDPEEDLADMKAMKKHIFSPWRKEAMVQMQFSQSYISPNWYQGGNKLNLMLLTILKGTINYKYEHISWENLGEWRAGVANVPGDTLRIFNVNDDMFRLYSKFGYSIAKNLYLSTSAEFKTSVFRTWNANVKTMKTDFMTPARFNLSLGLDYQPVKGLSIVISPATYKLLYARRIDDKIDEQSLGLPAGKHLLNDFGSSIRVTWKWTPVREVALNTELYMFTNYVNRHEIDWVTDCNFIINRFLTTRISLHPRFSNAENKKIQFKELISIGFAHKFR